MRSKKSRVGVACVIALLALAIRVASAINLPIDYDEAIYLRGAQTYASAIRPEMWEQLTDDTLSPENPPLVKLIMGAALATQPQQLPITTDLNITPPDGILFPTRAVNAVFGALTAAALALLSPLAGLMLAAHSLHIKYSSEVLLEALPALTSLVCVMAYARAKKQSWSPRWLAVSAIALGLTAASKYVYCLCAIAILADWLPGAKNARQTARRVAIWGALAALVFLLADPYLWPNPVGRLLATLEFHRANSSSAINTGKYVGWQPLVWLATPHLARLGWLVQPDAAIFVLAGAGLIPLWRKQRVFAVWLVLGMAFLLAYSNKWPQYGLIVVAPLSLAASAGAAAVWAWLASAAPRVSFGGALAGVMALAALAWCIWLGGNWHTADPSFQQANAAIRAAIQPDETAIFVTANPGIELATQNAGQSGWNWSPSAALSRETTALGYPEAASLLNAQAEGKMGVWLLTYQGNYGDPSDTTRALLQRQAHLLSPAFTQVYSRSYELSHFRFDQPYTANPPASQFARVQIDGAYGNRVGLSSAGCAILSVNPAADPAKKRVELGCLWHTRPFVALDWQTKVSVRLVNAKGETLANADQPIARSGFPIVRFEGVIFGNYSLEIPANLAGGGYSIAVFAYTQGKEFAPRVVLPLPN